MEISKLAYPESFILVVQNGEIESQENFMILEEVQKYIHRKLGINLDLTSEEQFPKLFRRKATQLEVKSIFDGMSRDLKNAMNVYVRPGMIFLRKDQAQNIISKAEERARQKTSYVKPVEHKEFPEDFFMNRGEKHCLSTQIGNDILLKDVQECFKKITESCETMPKSYQKSNGQTYPNGCCTVKFLTFNMLWNHKHICSYFTSSYRSYYTEQKKINSSTNLVPPEKIDVTFIEKNLFVNCKNWNLYNASFDKTK